VNISLPGVVLMVLLGLFAGAVLAFFRARQMRDVPAYLGLGVGGFLLGQVLAILLPAHPFAVGVVDLVAGVLGIVFLAGIRSLAQEFLQRGGTLSRRNR